MRRTNLLIAAGLAVFVLGLPLGILLLLVPSEQNCGTSSPASPSAPPPGTQTAGQVVRYLESQRFAPFGAAGIVGNLQQESGLNPTEAGGGLAQWNPSWYARMSAWATGHGLSPTSIAGQLEYLAFDLRSSYPQLVSELNSATSPQEAATMFETTYELCSGYVAYMVVIPGSLCNDPNRRTYASAAYTAAGRLLGGGDGRAGFTEWWRYVLPERLADLRAAGGGRQLVHAAGGHRWHLRCERELPRQGPDPWLFPRPR